MITLPNSGRLGLLPIANSTGSILIANTLFGSILGFVFWLVAARVLPPEQLGLGAAYVAAITLLASISEMGIGTTIIRFAPILSVERTAFINSGLALGAALSGVTAVVFALGTPLWSTELAGLSHSPLLVAGFVVTVVLFAVTQLLDRVFVAFEQARSVLLRNLTANLVRIVLLGSLAGISGAFGLIVAVAGGSAMSAWLAISLLRRDQRNGYRPGPGLRWPLWRNRLGYASGNHLATLLWGLPPLVYPLIVVSRLGPGTNATFYVNWMIANLLFVVPLGMTTAAFARAAGAGFLDERWYWERMRRTLGGLIVPVAALGLAGPLTLRLIGEEYSTNDRVLLLLLAISAIPYATNTWVITWHRIHQRTVTVVLSSLAIVGACLGLSIVLAELFGLTGVGLGWLVGQTIGLGVAWVSRHDVQFAARQAQRARIRTVKRT